MSHVPQTFSELWYRVADFQPRLSHHLMVRRQTYRHETWFLLGDPASSKFYRFNAPAYRFLGLLDGKRTVQEAWDVCNSQLGDDAPTQTDCINLLAQLQLFGLLRNDLPIDPDRLRERIDQIRERKHAERVGGYVFYTIPLINPERILARYVDLARIVFCGKGMIAVGLLALFALSMIIPRWADMASAANNIIAPQNLIFFTLSLFLMKVVHEFAHGFACKAYGGRVTEIGIFMMMVLPLPYCDATSSWAFSSKWQRIMVASAGMMIEVAMASVAALIWVYTSPGAVHSIAYNFMFIASVMTVVFNLNPLLRYDGYYMLADYLEIPNMTARSHELFKYLTRRYAFGLKGEQAPPLESRREGGWMIAHACCAFPYRMLVVVGIVLFVANQYFIIGFLLGVFGGIMWLVVPVFKGLSYVVSDPAIQVVRPRAVGVTFGTLALLFLLIGVVPMPSRVWASGVIEPRQMITYRAANNGYLRDLGVNDGDAVVKDQVLLRVHNPVMTGDFEKARARLQLANIRMRAAIATSPAAVKLAEPLLKDAEAQYESLNVIAEDMLVRADFAGRVVAPSLDARDGAFVTRGADLVTLADFGDLIIRAYISDSDFALLVDHDGSGEELNEVPGGRVDSNLIQAEQVQGKIYGMAGRTFDLDVDRGVTVGLRGIQHPALGHTVEGGDIALDAAAPDQQGTINPQWEVRLRFADPDALQTDIEHRWFGDAEAFAGEPGALPGTRVRVRFTLRSEPWAAQWYRSLRRSFMAQFGM